MNTHRLWHGADGDKILFILKNGKMIPDSQNEIYFDETSYGNCFQHGGDRKRGACFVLELEVNLNNQHYYRTQKYGNPTTLVVETAAPLSVKFLGMHIRRGNPTEGYEFDYVAEIQTAMLRLQ